MTRTDVIIVGAGQAGLALSRILADFGVDHVLLERARVAERWRSERRPSLTLLTPNWFTRLPDWRYDGPDPDGYMTAPDTGAFLAAYAASFGAPVVEGAEVLRLSPRPGGWVAETAAGAWRARAAVIATGAAQMPRRPGFAGRLSPSIRQIDARDYRTPDALAPGGVLVVGAGASGVQIADDLARAGRRVWLAVGGHIRLPRRYRGQDIVALMDRAGVFDDRAEATRDPARARAAPSLQLAGRTAPVDLPALASLGVALLGRAEAAEGARMRFAGDLAATTARAEATRARLLARIDGHPPTAGLPAPDAAPPFLAASRVETRDLAAERIGTVVWAVGYRREWPWLAAPAIGTDGELIQSGGVCALPGLYALGLPFMRRRRSTFIDGAGADAEAIALRLLAGLARGLRAAA